MTINLNTCDEVELAAHIATRFDTYIMSGSCTSVADRCNRLLRVLADKLGTDRADALERVRSLID